jgi:imidazolonepropionase-like amidohydrolase
MLDGKGGIDENTSLVIEGSKIAGIDPHVQKPTYDLQTLMVMPGMIDVHVHDTWFFGNDGLLALKGDSTAEDPVHTIENLHLDLMAGFTTVQNAGPSDPGLRGGIQRGIIPVPRVLTGIKPITNKSGEPEQIRESVRQLKAKRADFVKIIASGGLRNAGQQKMSQDQLDAACSEAKTQGLRTIVHAFGADSIKASIRAGCGEVEHGLFVDDDGLKMMADKGVYFDPNIGVVLQNYLRNEAGFRNLFKPDDFAAIERAIPLSNAMFKRALATPGLKIVMGTDAVAGAHGRNADELIARVKQDQSPMDAIISATSLSAKSLNMDNMIGSIAPGMEADIIAVEGNPIKDITALSHVTFVMKGGKVYKNSK